VVPPCCSLHFPGDVMGTIFSICLFGTCVSSLVRSHRCTFNQVAGVLTVDL
jgi:hypothetical protein